MKTKILPHHLNRNAYIYLRQSTMQQLEDHVTSTQRQYALSDLAQKLGWRDAQIYLIDEDLGKSGVSAVGRTGFNSLVTAVGSNQVGAIFISEISRLGRSQADLHILLNLCGLTNTLVIDYDGTYDLNDSNDLILLSIKGVLSQTELHTLRLRMYEGKLQKARNAELQFRLPTGYVHDSDGNIVFDPDEAVVEQIRLVFRKFRELRTIGRVVKYFTDNKLLIPVRSIKARKNLIEWKPLTRSRANKILKNPTYAGVYAFGKSQSTSVAENGQIVRTRRQEVPRGQWHNIIYDSHPAYISWNEFLENERQRALNSRSKNPSGQSAVPREGAALLQGLVICGKCGRRMHPTYSKPNQYFYACNKDKRAYSSKGCWTTLARWVDEAVETQVLESINQAQLYSALSVLAEVESATEEKNRQWQAKLNQAQRATKRAEQQFYAADQANRAVVSKLEARWEEKLNQLEELEKEYANARNEQQLVVSEEQRQQILHLAENLPLVWKATTTTYQERKEMLGLLVKQVAIAPLDSEEHGPQIQIKILWHSGAINEVTVSRTRKPHPHTNLKSTIELVRELRANKTVSEIAQELNHRGILTAHGNPFTVGSVEYILRRYDIRRYKLKKVEK